MMKLGVLLLSGIMMLSDIENPESDDQIDVGKTNTSVQAVTMEMMDELNKEYEKNFDFNGASYLEENSLCVMNRDPYMQILVGTDGYTDYECRSLVASTVLPVFLTHIFTDQEIFLTATPEELEEYFKSTEEISRDIRDKAEYVQRTFSETQYGGVFYDKEAGKVSVYVTDQSISEELEQAGILCVDGSYSLDVLYETLREVWKYRKEWGINYIEVNPCINRIVIYGSDREGISRRLAQKEITCAVVKQGVVLHPGDLDRTLDLGNLKTDDPAVVYHILKSERGESDTKIREGLKILKEEYPEYECRNLLIRIVADGNYERYLDFDEELIDFVNELPEYNPNTKDPVEELLFGDPQRIELKSQLREYRNVYPEKDYEQIYQEFLADWEDTSMVSREKKMYDLTINRFAGELSVDNQTQEKKMDKKDEDAHGTSDTLPAAVAGCVALALGSMVLWRIKK